MLSKLSWGLNACLLSCKHIERLDVFHMWCLRAIMRIPHAYHSRVPNLTIWEGTKGVPISILIWEHMLRFLGHLFRAEDTDTTKSVAFHYQDGYWRPVQLSTARARGRPHEGWAHWARGEAMSAAEEVSVATTSHIDYFPTMYVARKRITGYSPL